jgi:DNA-binding NtrC family response regulator
LRVLEKREVRRIGGSEPIAVDIRLIAATNRSLRSEVKRAAFREDLYFRVAGAHVVVPPLRERKSDLPALVARFWAEAAPSQSVDELPASTWQALLDYGWPGNVRELRNAVQRLLVTPERALELSELEPSAEEAAAESVLEFRCLKVARREASERFERAYLGGLLRRAQGNITVAASMAQVSRQAIHKLIAKHRL